MKITLHAFLVALLATPLSACGNKGTLKTPAQAERDAAKKARKAEDAREREAKHAAAEEPQPQPTAP